MGEEGCESVPAGEFGHINSHPSVMDEVKKLDLAKEGSRDGRRCESPRVRIAAEIEAGYEKADANAGLGAGYQRQLREDVWSTGSRHRDPYQATLGFSRLDLALYAGYGNLGGGRFPLFLGTEPCDGLFMGLNLGCRGLDAVGVYDLPEFQAGREMENVFGRIGAGRWLVGVGNRDKRDVDLQVGIPLWPDLWRRGRQKARGAAGRAVDEANLSRSLGSKPAQH